MTLLLTRLSAAAIFLIFLAAAPSAAAQEPVLPEEFSAADQYVESVPTSSGPKSTKEVKRKAAKGQQSLPAPVARAVNDLEPALKEVATSPDLGAPERRLPDASAETPSVPSATVSAIDDANGGRLPWLLLALVVSSVAIAGTAAYRHRARKQAGS